MEGTHSKPFAVAVDADAIYWTDTNNNALWKMSKYGDNSVPKRVRDFSERPMGLIAKNIQITTLPHCHNLYQAEKKFNKSVVEVFKQTDDEDVQVCLNGGEMMAGNQCKCRRGYMGGSCEISLCHNYCVHGDCYLSARGFTQCRCHKSFSGARCERDLCDGFCLNGGFCQRDSSKEPSCKCQEGFAGRQCERSSDICRVFCEERKDEVLMSDQNEVICRFVFKRSIF